MKHESGSAEARAGACLSRIALRDGDLRAWVHVAEDAALAHARALDREPPRGPLHGVPVGIKDVFDTADMPTEYGSPIYRGHRPVADAAAVALLRKAGCVVLGKTATAEFAFTHPPATRNPHDPEHTPGGSSSGSAAAVADGMVPLALGTQTGGSVIRPAAYCGVIGFKPSFGSINRAGLKPVAESLDTVGTFSTSIEIAAAALHALSGLAVPDLSARVAPPRIAFVRTSHWQDTDEATKVALESAARRLAAAGAQVTDAELPSSADALFREQDIVMRYEGLRALAWELANREPEVSAVLRRRLDDARGFTRERYDAARTVAVDARRQFAGLMQDFDLVLTPSAPGEAPKGLTSTGNALFNRVWTLLGVPCITLPFATGAAGLPIGVQLAGAMDGDGALLQRARWVQDALA